MKTPLKKYDPVQRFDQGGTSLGEMREASDGDWVSLDDYSLLEQELEKVKLAAVPICVGPPIIGILAQEGQWVSSTSQALVAADGLFKKDPYAAIEALHEELACASTSLQLLRAERDAALVDSLAKNAEIERLKHQIKASSDWEN